jgi:hypothetical protein
MSHTSGGIVNVLTKAKRRFEIVNIEDGRTENAYAELFCVNCGKTLGKCELHYSSHECYKYCHECRMKFIKQTPFRISDIMTVLEDYGNSVILRYEDIRQEEDKQCYFSSKGRYINVKGKRYYI